MHSIAYLWLKNFYVKALGFESLSSPCFVVRDGVAIDCNETASQLGVTAGMLVGEASMLTEGKGRHLWKPEEYVKDQKVWLDLCASLTDIIEPVEANSALLDLSGHPDPFFLIHRLQQALETLGWRSNVGVAGTRWIAQLASEKCRLGNNALVTPRKFISDKPTIHLPIPREQSKRIEFLGYKTIGEVAEIPLEVLRKQFGNDALEIARYANGGGSTLVQALYPPNSITESFWFEGSPDTFECFEFGLKRTADKIVEKLLNDDLVGERLDLFVEHSQGEISQVGRTFSKPYHSLQSLWANVKLMAPKCKTQDVEALRLRAGDLKNLNRIQMDFELGFHRSNGKEKVSRALHQVHGVFGHDSVKLGSEIIEPRRQKVLRAWRQSNGWM